MPNILLVIAFSLAAILTPCRAGPGFSCYSYQARAANESDTEFNSTSAKLLTQCASCVKIYVKSTFSNGTVMYQQNWQCSGDAKSEMASAFPCSESIMISYNADSENESRLCTCCGNACNNGTFCDGNDERTRRVKKAISGGASARQLRNSGISCYNNVTSPLAAVRQKVDLMQKCKGCQKSENIVRSKMFNSEYQCIRLQPQDENSTNSGNNTSTSNYCYPYISATINSAGIATSLTCTCCSDKCNGRGGFCNLNGPETLSQQLANVDVLDATMKQQPSSNNSNRLLASFLFEKLARQLKLLAMLTFVICLPFLL